MALCCSVQNRTKISADDKRGTSRTGWFVLLAGNCDLCAVDDIPRGVTNRGPERLLIAFWQSVFSDFSEGLQNFRPCSFYVGKVDAFLIPELGTAIIKVEIKLQQPCFR